MLAQEGWFKIEYSNPNKLLYRPRKSGINSYYRIFPSSFSFFVPSWYRPDFSSFSLSFRARSRALLPALAVGIMENRDLTLAFAELFESLNDCTIPMYLFIYGIFDFFYIWIFGTLSRSAANSILITRSTLSNALNRTTLGCMRIFYLAARPFSLLFTFSDLKATAPFVALALPVFNITWFGVFGRSFSMTSVGFESIFFLLLLASPVYLHFMPFSHRTHSCTFFDFNLILYYKKLSLLTYVPSK